jgi:EAL domain-containing protein (putative c-di-GMP-specific phosphodiesterase class I)
VAVAEMLGEFAGRIDAPLLAEGIETRAELAASAQLGVPRAQGWLLGRPSPDFAPLGPEAEDPVLPTLRELRAGTRDGAFGRSVP